MNESLMCQFIEKPTRFRIGQTPSLLDLVLANEGFVGDVQYLAPLGSSDHAVLVFEVRARCPMGRTTSTLPSDSKNYNKGNFGKARALLKEIDWSPLSEGSIEDAWRFFKKCVHDVCDKTIPTHQRRRRKKNMFMTKEALDLKKKKDASFKSYHKDPSAINYCEYKKNRNMLRSLTRKLRAVFEKRLVVDLKKNSKTTFGSTATLSSKTKSG